MKTFWTIIVIFLVLIIVFVLISVGDDTNDLDENGPNATSTQDGIPQELELTDSHSSPNNGFRIRFSSEMGFLVTAEQIESLGYVALCDPETSLVCVIYLEELLPGRNFHGGAVSVSIDEDKTTEESCTAQEDNEMEAVDSMSVDGEVFVGYGFGEAATSRQVRGAHYRALVHNRCYQIATRIETTTFEVYEAGTIQRFTNEEREHVESELMRVIDSIEFLSEE
ncbi:MAG: hypothetical protein Q8P45_00180 [Candidatus Harrisonbacteria bacterium]|nr:hypothetical protein [Candidatus Harrisonbacteria bacterium]